MDVESYIHLISRMFMVPIPDIYLLDKLLTPLQRGWRQTDIFLPQAFSYALECIELSQKCQRRSDERCMTLNASVRWRNWVHCEWPQRYAAFTGRNSKGVIGTESSVDNSEQMKKASCSLRRIRYVFIKFVALSTSASRKNSVEQELRIRISARLELFW